MVYTIKTFLTNLFSMVHYFRQIFQMKSWAGKALETVDCFAFLKFKLTVVIRAC
jgi:hypothetical protein